MTGDPRRSWPYTVCADCPVLFTTTPAPPASLLARSTCYVVMFPDSSFPILCHTFCHRDPRHRPTLIRAPYFPIQLATLPRNIATPRPALPLAEDNRTHSGPYHLTTLPTSETPRRFPTTIADLVLDSTDQHARSPRIASTRTKADARRPCTYQRSTHCETILSGISRLGSIQAGLLHTGIALAPRISGGSSCHYWARFL
ncbi:hypothetical protein FJTKL_14884 [Diaporthe vaccinii]|uniref:Uncharacterized protein n=1 Tax=Diaporthe vaccinii TaxID=105482 RepID=A0ABR4F8F6_9PEZI